MEHNESQHRNDVVVVYLFFLMPKNAILEDS